LYKLNKQKERRRRNKWMSFILEFNRQQDTLKKPNYENEEKINALQIRAFKRSMIRP
jgi:hypothetical protein